MGVLQVVQRRKCAGSVMSGFCQGWGSAARRAVAEGSQSPDQLETGSPWRPSWFVTPNHFSWLVLASTERQSAPCTSTFCRS